MVGNDYSLKFYLYLDSDSYYYILTAMTLSYKERKERVGEDGSFGNHSF